MRQTENIEAVASLGVDALGFIFYPKSPRHCLPMLDPESIEKLPVNTKKVGVFVNSSLEVVRIVAKVFGLTGIQLHGHETASMAESLADSGLEVWKAFGINNDFDFDETLPFQQVCSAFVFDTKSDSHGGSGQKYNWDKLKEYQGKTPFLLSGGIKPGDELAIKQFTHPACMGLDLNSGFEMEPGLKDAEAIRIFMEQLH